MTGIGRDHEEHGRLKGLEEFETPEFVGRMERVQRQRAIAWRAMLVTALVVGGGLGLLL